MNYGNFTNMSSSDPAGGVDHRRSLAEGEGAWLLVHLDDLLNIFEENLDQSYGRLRP